MEDRHLGTDSVTREKAPSVVQFRLLGFVPLIFFIAQALYYWSRNESGHMLWMCNIGNLLLAIGLFLSQSVLVRVAVIWMIPGLVVWFKYVALPWFDSGFTADPAHMLASTLAHIGGIGVGTLAIKKVRMDRAAWVYALGWYLIIQLLSRLLTPVQLNVNVSHDVDPGWRQAFSAYWKFWLVLTLGTAVILWILGWLLYKLWPANSSSRLRKNRFRVRRQA